ncbi:MAG: alpha-ribazole phosphatase [Candidatus Petromonas sp.]|jgi:alpha-ribazole phosphatase|nr:alpha-ribazole phosphatase [Candidatus Petromonas sp.]
MTEIIFVRHGESCMNRKGVFCGWSNSPLTDRGIKQALDVREKLKNEKIDLIISSDLDRCFKTAELINENHNIKIVREPGLKELNFGEWEGLSYEEICTRFPEVTELWQNDYINFKIPLGESLREMYERVNRTYKNILNKHEKSKILIVSHSGVIRSILSEEICGNIESYWKFKIENCGIARLGYVDDFPVLKGINQ